MHDKRAEQDAARFGILSNMEDLEADLMANVPDIVHVEFDIRDYGDTHQVILIPKYSIDIRREDYFDARRNQLLEIIKACYRHGLEPSGDTIEDYGEHWYIVRNCNHRWSRFAKAN